MNYFQLICYFLSKQNWKDRYISFKLYLFTNLRYFTMNLRKMHFLPNFLMYVEYMNKFSSQVEKGYLWAAAWIHLVIRKLFFVVKPRPVFMFLLRKLGLFEIWLAFLDKKNFVLHAKPSLVKMSMSKWNLITIFWFY